jgi:folate-binding protein YgfZ
MSTIPELFYIDRSERGRLKLTGRDRQTFLQGMVTNDVASLKPGDGCYAFMLDATGHVLADMRILCAEDHLLLDVEQDMSSFVAETLDKYLIMERVKITDVSLETGQFHVGGIGAPGVFLRGDHPEGVNWWDSDTCLGAVTRLTAFPGFELYFPARETEGIKEMLYEHGGTSIKPEFLEALRIEAGIPCFGVDMDSRVLAPETGQRSRAINYRKGCYIGQEIVARIDARGHTNREFAGFYLNTVDLPAKDTAVTVEEKEVGRITSAAIGPQTGLPIALGYIRNEYRTAGTVVMVGEQHAVVAELPFRLTGT